MKRILILCFFALFISATLRAIEVNFENIDFSSAEAAESYVKFDLSGSKLGLISSEFTGYVKNYTLSFDISADIVSNLRFTSKAVSLDTDIGMRNDKLHETILEADKFPEIKLMFPGNYSIEVFPQELTGFIFIKGLQKEIRASVKLQNQNGKYVLEGKMTTGIRYLELPDPSIMIAKVNDPIKISFRFVIPPKN